MEQPFFRFVKKWRQDWFTQQELPQIYGYMQSKKLSVADPENIPVNRDKQNRASLIYEAIGVIETRATYL